MPILLSLLISFSFGAIDNFNVSGSYSYKDLSEEVSSNSNFYYVYAGFVNVNDSEVPVNCGTDATCNTCSGDFSVVTPAGNPPSDSDTPGEGVHVCNARALDTSSSITFTFASDIDAEGKVYMSSDIDETSAAFCETTGEFGSDSSVSITCTWDDICEEMDNNTDCVFTEEENKTFYIGKDTSGDDAFDTNDDYVRVKITANHANAFIDENTALDDCSNEGVCSYQMFPGDNKAYLEKNNFTTKSLGSELENIRIYYQENIDGFSSDCGNSTAAQFGYGSTQYVDLQVSESDSYNITGDRIVNGLSNGVQYCFRTAIVDEVGFVRGITDKASNSYTGSKVTPEEVTGLIQEGNCFIATAAFGSAVDKRLDILRQFRDQVLQQFSIGQKFVDFYYENSKPLAYWIAKNEWAKTITQILLWPILLIAYLLLNPAYLIILAVFTLGYFIYERKARAI